jgi:putative transposase
VTLRRPRRIEGFSYRGLYRYLLTFCTANRLRHFERADLVATARSRIQQTSVEENFSIVAYCFMPDHLHLVVEGLGEDADLQRFVKIGKQRVVYSLRENHSVRDVWQEGFHDWVLRPEQTNEAVIRYVLNNPVRAGLVEKPEDYPFSWSKYPLV